MALKTSLVIAWITSECTTTLTNQPNFKLMPTHKVPIYIWGKVNVNDDPGLEKEANVMGAKAMAKIFDHHVGGGKKIIKES